MGLAQQRLTLDEYLAWEAQQAERHEFHRGEVCAMVGARRVHGQVVTNLVAALAQQLKGTPCRVFSEAMKVSPAQDTILYPDVFVTCDPADLRTDTIFRAPRLVIEVLSPGTQACDRSAKFALYRRLASLQEYGLVDPDSRRVEVLRADAQGRWEFIDMSDAAEVEFQSVACRIAVPDLFDGIDPD